MTLEELYRLLRSSHVQAQGIVNTLQEPLVVLDANFVVINANPSFFQTFRTDREATIGRSLFELGNGQWDVPELRLLLSSVVPKSAVVVDYEVTHDFPGIGHRSMLLTARRLSHPEEAGTSILLALEDVTEQRKADADRDAQLAEAAHRMKNLLAVLHAVANQTAVDGQTVEQYRDKLMGRFTVVVEAQIMVAADGEGADLAALIKRTVTPVAGARAVIAPSPAVALAPHQILPMSMILHELVTNALKYGALSSTDGEVRISWVTEDHDGADCLVLDWSEHGGPPVEPPSRRGYGTNLIRHSARSEGGSVDLTYAPEGLSAHLVMPLAR